MNIAKKFNLNKHKFVDNLEFMLLNWYTLSLSIKGKHYVELYAHRGNISSMYHGKLIFHNKNRPLNRKEYTWV